MSRNWAVFDAILALVWFARLAAYAFTDWQPSPFTIGLALFFGGAVFLVLAVWNWNRDV